MVETDPGQEHYNDLVSRRQAIDADNTPDYSDLNTDYSAGTDYSGASSGHSNLAAMEKAAADKQGQTTASVSSDDTTGQRERNASFETSGFDNAGGKAAAIGKSALRGTGLGRMKTKAIVSIIGVICGFAVVMAGFTTVSGPLQLVQAASVVMDFTTNIVSNQQNARSFNAMNFLTNTKVTGSAAKSRMGILGEHQADVMEKRLKANGVSFADDGGIKIDAKKSSVFGDGSKLTAENVAERLGLSDSSKIHVDGESISIDHNLKYSEARNALTAMDDVGKNGLASRLQTRSVMKREGYTSWLHPIQKAQNYGENKLKGFINKLRDKINKNDDEKVADVADDDKKEAEDGADDPDDPDDNGNPKHKNTSESEIENGVKNGLDTVEEATKQYDFLEKNGRRGIVERAATNGKYLSDVLENLNKKNSLADNKFQTLVAILCTAFNAFNDIGPYKWVHIVAPAMRIANTVVGYGAQVKSGEDIDVDTAGLAVKTVMGDDVDVIDSEGNKTSDGKTEFNSFWDSPVVCAELQLNNCASDNENSVPSALKTASNSARLTGNDDLDNTIGKAIDTQLDAGNGFGHDVLQGACLLLPAFGEALDTANTAVTVINLLLTPVTGGVSGLADLGIQVAISVGIGMVLAIVMQLMRNWMLGTVLDVNGLLPTQWGSVTMFGGKFTSNNQALSMGGRKLTSTESMELRLDNRRYLAWRNSKKSVIARLADPSDYNSSLNQLARIVKINNSDQSFTTQFANTFKVFASAPNILATANNAVFGGNAYAASRYDYGVSDYAWSMSELDSIVNNDPYANASDAIDIYRSEDTSLGVSAENTPLHYYSEKCLAVKIGDDDEAKVQQLDNTDGKSWNYKDNGDRQDCQDLSQNSNVRKLRLYVMDYFNTVTSACYNGEATDATSSEACDEMGAGKGNTTGGDSSDSSSSSGSASGATGDGAALAAEFEKDTNNSGDYDGAYGRQCVDLSLWYVAKHTTLKSSSCNGNCFVEAMKSANPQLTVIKSGVPTAPAVFSTDDHIMGRHSPSYGHTGVVVSVDSDGTIHTIETGNAAGKVWYGTYKKNEYQGARFASVKDYLK